MQKLEKKVFKNVYHGYKNIDTYISVRMPDGL